LVTDASVARGSWSHHTDTHALTHIKLTQQQQQQRRVAEQGLRWAQASAP
jgi:hypothetical protein